MTSMDQRMALNAQILAQGRQDEALSRSVPTAATVRAHTTSIANKSKTEWNMGGGVGTVGRFQEHWPEHLPRPPSRKNLNELDDEGNNAGNAAVPQVIVFNANTQEGSSMVRVLAEKGLRVVAVVRVFTSRNAKALIKLKRVSVQVADLNNLDAVKQAAAGCQQAFLVTKYWERFENWIEEDMCKVVLQACADVGVQRLVLATFEDTAHLRARGGKSQIMPTADGRIFPKFDGMNSIWDVAKGLGVQVTNMMTSYLDEADGSKKSLILIRGENGKIITQSHMQ